MPRIAIAGNPNAGKTSIFNRLTGASQRVSNYPGVTVERKEGNVRVGEGMATVVDLPGTYSLTAYSQEEIIARDYIVEERPEAVVDVVDASNLERNLYLAIQIMETGGDLRGRQQPKLRDLGDKCRLLIIPAGNPDGIARFEPRSARGMTHDEFQFSKACHVDLEQILDIQLTLYEAMLQYALDAKGA